MSDQTKHPVELSKLCAREALTDQLIRAGADSRPSLQELLPGGVYGVFDFLPAGISLFLGLVSSEQIAMNPERILADLVPVPIPAPVHENTPLEVVKGRLESEHLAALAVVNDHADFIGAVTQTSLLNALLNREQELLAEARRSYADLPTNRRQSASWPEQLKSLSLATRSLLRIMNTITLERHLLESSLEYLTRLLSARYGAIGILDEHGQLTEFIHTGLSEEQAQHIGKWPEGKGLLGVPLVQNQILRLENLNESPHAAGFPPGHPPMRNLLAVSISHAGQIYGRLYLCDKTDGRFFDGDDELLVATFADTLALAIRNVWNQEGRRRAEEQLRIAASVFETSSEGVIITDAKANIVMVNRALTTITGYSEDEVIGRKPSMFSSGRHDQDFYREMWRSLDETGQWQGEIWNKRKSGEIYPEWLSITALKDDRQDVTRYIGVFADLTSRKFTDSLINQLVSYDHLTELPNRLMFREHLKRAILRAHSHGKQAALLYLDVDRFKTINDTFGHQIGDRLLQQVAERLTKCLRENDRIRRGDIIARLSGDEFAMIVNGLSQLEDVKKIALRVLETFTDPFLLGDRTRRITATIGIALGPRDAENIDDLIRHADLAMYDAKHQGRNTYQFYSGKIHKKNSTRLDLENDLYGALERREFSLYHQPQVDLRNGRIVSTEALIRWHHPDRGMISPDQFVPLLEDTGLINPVGEWVLEQACRDCLHFRKTLGTDLSVSVNLSGHQFRNNLTKEIGRILAHVGLPPSQLKLELTESLAMHQVQETIAVLDQLADMGIDVLIDDFGTGYSSLSYLRQFKISALKIDKSFIAGPCLETGNGEIVRAIIGLAHNLNLHVVAEGVESHEQLEFLLGHHCHLGQGYLFSRPLPPSEITQLVGWRMDHGSRPN
ncbi:EAL domain-containing protein [Methylocaldum sp.]|uniref:EAL domain-containing protein n=1 Tax=Methylocaldum sp. TaxID=1969727 RepID=UPI002D22173B|nr:EAL domain-containing protein [Methylocaldum sp.]HYE34454.1 EAL domain-containing protein [Methylocaldum sp.]